MSVFLGLKYGSLRKGLAVDFWYTLTTLEETCMHLPLGGEAGARRSRSSEGREEKRMRSLTRWLLALALPNTSQRKTEGFPSSPFFVPPWILSIFQ